MAGAVATTPMPEDRIPLAKTDVDTTSIPAIAMDTINTIAIASRVLNRLGHEFLFRF